MTSAHMSRDEWDALVDRARACDMIEIAQAYGAQLRKSSGEFVGACPVCGAGDDRFAVNPRKEVFNCRVCGEGGRGSIDLEMFLGDCDFVEAVKRLTNTTSLSDQHPPIAKDAHKRKQDEAGQYEAKQHATAIWRWRQREPAAGSPVETYLQARGYTSAIPPTIGYLPARGEYPHAMISAIALPNEIEPGKLGTPV